MSKEEILEEIQKEREVEQNKRDAIKLANQIYTTISNPKVVKESTAEQRHKICIQKFKNFAEAFPLVLAKMSRDLKYNEKAFRRYLDRLHEDPGKGMDGVMERQADYAKFLYLEECRATGRHWNMKTANAIWKQEHDHMKSWVKKTKTQEKEAKSEFEQEQKMHLQDRKQELLDFLQEAKNIQQQENPDEFKNNQLDLDQLDMSSMSDSEELPESLVDPTEKQNRDTVVSQEPSVAQTEEEKQIEEKYKKEYEARLACEKQAAELVSKERSEQMRKDMIKDSLINTWRMQKTKTALKKKTKKSRRR